VPHGIHRLACRPDLPRPTTRFADLFQAASETLVGYLTPGAIVVYESTVYPGVTEEFCGAIIGPHLWAGSGRDFKSWVLTRAV